MNANLEQGFSETEKSRRKRSLRLKKPTITLVAGQQTEGVRALCLPPARHFDVFAICERWDSWALRRVCIRIELEYQK